MRTCNAVQMDASGVEQCTDDAAFRIEVELDVERASAWGICCRHLPGALKSLHRRYGATVATVTLLDDADVSR